jgi:hypothetical protein
MKYKKKPVVVDAIKFTDITYDNEILLDWCNADYHINAIEGNHLIIETLEGNHRADIGDYIIKGVKGEFYPCKPDIFEMTYEKVED